MPAVEVLREVGERVGRCVAIDAVASNELLAERAADPGGYDLVFPSDYLVERMIAAEQLCPLAHDRLGLEHLADWVWSTAYDPGCRFSVPFAFGTTGFLTRGAGTTSWAALFAPGPDARVGMLEEVREVIGAALLASGYDPNDVSDAALDAARELLVRQRPSVVRYDSHNFVDPIVSGEVSLQHAWSGPAAAALRRDSTLRYVVPQEGAIHWVTTAAIPSDAPDPERSHALLAALMDPELAAQTTERTGFATPNESARRRLPEALRNDTVLFPDADVLQRCRPLRDLGPDEPRLLRAWSAPA